MIAPKIEQVARIFFLTAIVLVMLIALSIWAPQLAFAQGAKPAAAPAASSGTKPPPKRTAINFEDQLIEGQTQKPELFYMLQQRSPNFKRLIKLRENFIPEMQDTAEDMNRGQASGH